MSKENIRGYRYKREDKFSVDVIVEGDTLRFINAVYPEDTDVDIVNQLYDEAEKAALKQEAKKE